MQSLALQLSKKMKSKRKMRTKKKQGFSLLEILVAISILVLVSALLGVKVVDLLAEHKFKNASQAFLEDLRQLQALSVSHGTDCSISIYKNKGDFYYSCASEADLKLAPFFTPHSLKGVKNLSINQKKCDIATLTIYSTGRIEPNILLGLHKQEGNLLEKSLWIDARKPLLISASEKLPVFPLTPIAPSMPVREEHKIDK